MKTFMICTRVWNQSLRQKLTCGGNIMEYYHITAPATDGVFASKEPSQEKMDSVDDKWKDSMDDYIGIAIYQWYLAQDGLGDVSQVTMFGLSGAAAVMSMMAVAAFVGSLLAALLLGRIARAFKDSRIPAIAACLLFVVAVVLPLTPIDSAMAVALYALFAGFAYVVYDGVSQGLNLATLPDVRSVGRSLAAFSLANTFGSLIGAVVCAIAIAVTGEYLLIFAVAAGCMAVAGVLTLLLK